MTNTAIRCGAALAVLLLAMPAGAQTISPDGVSGFGGTGELGLGNDGGGGMLDMGLGAEGTANIIDFNGDGVLDLANGDILDTNGNGIVDGEERVNADVFDEDMEGGAQLAVNAENETDLWLMLFGPGEGGDAAQTASIETTPAEPGMNRGANRITVTGTGRREADCFAPDPTQIAYLLGRNNYDATVTDAWSGAADVSIVPVHLCPDARSGVEAVINADPNMDALRRAVEATTTITATLEPQFEVDDVLAVDRSGANLTVYVY
ncbi:MAG: hypothetical protein ABW003_17890 [Microvirga sp.]